MLAVLGALREELIGLQRRMTVEETSTWRDCRLHRGKYRGKDIVLVRTGLGKGRAEAAAGFVLEHYPVSAMVSLGFAGALTGRSKVGDIVLCSRLHCGNGWPGGGGDSGTPFASHAGLFSLALRCLEGAARAGVGSSVTVAEPVSMPAAKLALGKAFGADVADMEGYWLARAAAEKQVPFLAVRAVSDAVQDELPPFERFLGDSASWRWRRAVLYFVSRPQRVIGLVVLYLKSRQARRSLTGLADRLITAFDSGQGC